MSAAARRLALSGCLMAVGTWLIGWWAVMLVAALPQYFRRPEPPWHAAVAALLGWVALLLVTPLAPLGRLSGRLGDILRLPGWGAVVLTLAYVALLAWSSARVVRALRYR